MNIGKDTQSVVTFLQAALEPHFPPPTWRWYKSERAFISKRPWGQHILQTLVYTHTGPSALSISARLRHEQVEQWVWTYRPRLPSYFSDRQLASMRKTSTTLVQPIPADDRVDLPDESDRIALRLNRLAAGAQSWLFDRNDDQSVCDAILSERPLDDLVRMRHIAVLVIRGQLEEARSRLSGFLANKRSRELEEFAANCRPALGGKLEPS